MPSIVPASQEAVTQQIMKKAIEGQTITEIAKGFNRSYNWVSTIVNSPLFQIELQKNLSRIKEDFLKGQAEISPQQKVEKALLDSAITCHKELLVGNMDEGIKKAEVRLKSVSEVYNFLKDHKDLQISAAQIFIKGDTLERGFNAPSTDGI